MMGENVLGGSKAMKILGGEMSPDQMKKMLNEETKLRQLMKDPAEVRSSLNVISLSASAISVLLYRLHAWSLCLCCFCSTLPITCLVSAVSVLFYRLHAWSLCLCCFCSVLPIT